MIVRERWLVGIWVVGLVLFVCVTESGGRFGFAADEQLPEKSGSSNFSTIQGEILEVEELREPVGAAIYLVKDFASGQTIKLFADPYRALIRSGNETQTASSLLPGSKVTVIYQKSEERDIPEVVFVKVSGSY